MTLSHEAKDASLSQTLSSVLRSAKPSWKDHDLLAAEAKLAKLGIMSPEDLSNALDNNLNQRLHSNGLKAFSAETLEALRSQLEIVLAECRKEKEQNSHQAPEAPPQARSPLSKHSPKATGIPPSMSSLLKACEDNKVPPLEDFLAALDREEAHDRNSSGGRHRPIVPPRDVQSSLRWGEAMRLGQHPMAAPQSKDVSRVGPQHGHSSSSTAPPPQPHDVHGAEVEQAEAASEDARSGAAGWPTPASPITSQENSSIAEPMRRVIILRHGSRPDTSADPALDKLGREQAVAAASYFAQELKAKEGRLDGVSAIFCSPFLRALETAAPLSEALGLPIFVEWGFCELLAHGWLHSENPLPHLSFRTPEQLPMRDRIDLSYRTAVMPEYPDHEGAMHPGDEASRAKALKRHGDAVEAALRKVRGSSVLIVAHGSTHDFVAGALCGNRHPRRYHTPACVPHCGITEIVEEKGQWRLRRWGSKPWMQNQLREGSARAKPLPGRSGLNFPWSAAPRKAPLSASGIPLRPKVLQQRQILEDLD